MGQKISDDEIKNGLRNGLDLGEIGIKHNMNPQWKYTLRAKCVRAQFFKEQREGKKVSSPITSYFLPIDEVRKRYGRCGTFRENVIPTYKYGHRGGNHGN